MEFWELVVRESVRDTIARYNHAGDQDRVDELVMQFMPDGVLEVKDSIRLQGRSEIFDQLTANRTRRRQLAAEQGSLAQFARHHVSSVLIHSITPERAEATSYYAVHTQRGLDHWGRYLDVLVPHEGRWLFASRLSWTDATMSGSWAPGPRAVLVP
ncbi:MAG: nuclear transport factor 2 family protein [Ilumatobacteraceae bacterium]